MAYGELRHLAPDEARARDRASKIVRCRNSLFAIRHSPFAIRHSHLEPYTPTMRTRTFGRLGWPVSELGYGMWGLADWTGSDDAESIASLQLAVDNGVNFFDTAWAYGDGRSEQILQRLLKANPT